MKCRICARECPPGARICRDCAAARKRAFAATVTQPLLVTAGTPSVSREPRFAPRPARRRGRAALGCSEAAMTASAVELAAKPAHRSTKWPVSGIVVAIAIAIAVVVVVIKILASGTAPSPDAVIDSDRAATMPATKDDSSSPPLSPALRYAPAPGATNPAPSEGSEPERTTEASAAASSAAWKAARKLPSKLEAPKSAPVEAPPPAPKAEPVAVAPRSPAPRAIETPRDPWQAMNEALSRCAQEDFFGRIACEQRVRLQYCGNHWGAVPQCAIGPATDHGQ